MVAANLASLVAAHAGARTLLIDADFHRQTLTRSVAPGASQGLREALNQPALLAGFVIKLGRSGVDVLPCPAQQRIPNAGELLGSAGMAKLIEAARANYDVVVVEVAPILAVADFSMIGRFCDHFIFVVEWGKTSQRLVLESLSESEALLDQTLCIVLNKADDAALNGVESYKGTQYREYYQNGSVA